MHKDVHTFFIANLLIDYMKTLYKNGVAAKCDDRQIATLLASGWSFENAQKLEIQQTPKIVSTQVPKQIPTQRVAAPTQRVPVTKA